jgi:chorismate synthase
MIYRLGGPLWYTEIGGMFVAHMPRADAAPIAVAIRPLASLADYTACVALQRMIWGDAFDVVGAAILQISAHLGGIVAGAFDEDERLAGFVFGLTGLDDDNNVVHWSHMLGVRLDLRDAGVGRKLKEYQRHELARRQIGRMYWTFDPLIAKNAHFNLNVLGARVVRFAPDMYGNTGSALHHGLATDRLVVVCDTAAPPHSEPMTLDDIDAHTPVLSCVDHSDGRASTPGMTSAPRVRLEIPTDFAQLLADSPNEARTWHTATREAFQWAFANRYVVTGLRRDSTTARSFYILEVRP